MALLDQERCSGSSYFIVASTLCEINITLRCAAFSILYFTCVITSVCVFIHRGQV